MTVPHPVRTLLALAAVALFGASVTAQTTSDSVTRKFNLSDLLEKRGKIQIGLNVPTSLEFDEAIVESLIGRDDLLIDGVSKDRTISVSNNRPSPMVVPI